MEATQTSISRGMDKEDVGCVSERVVVVTLHLCVCVCVCVYEPSHWKRLILEKTEGKRRG